MSGHLWIKLLHILSATLLFGTGLGTAFFMLRAYLSGNAEAMRVTTQNVVLADWLFTTPAVVVQLVTGVWLSHRLGIAFGSLWFVLVMALFVFVGACWLPVVWIQIRIRRIMASGGDKSQYQKLMMLWCLLGSLAFGAVLLLFFLMVSKNGVDRMLWS